MKRIIFLVFLISLFSIVVSATDIPCLNGEGPLLIGQEYCPQYSSTLFNFLAPNHYEFGYISTFTHYFDIEQNDEEPLNIYVNFGFDLNNPNPTKDADKYRIVEEFDYYNYIRPSSSKNVIDNFYDYRVSTSDYSGLDKTKYDFVGMPVYLSSCFLDCNVNDNTPAIKFDLKNVPDIWYLNLATTYDVNTGGLVPYSWIEDRFELNREKRVPYSLRFENNYYQCSYDTTGIKSVAMGCTIEADTWMRHPNIDSVWGFWDLLDILPNNIPSGASSKTSWTIQKRIDVDIDNENYSVTVTTQDPTGGGYIPPTGEGLLEQTSTEINVEEQKAVYLLKETAELENSWQTNMLNIIVIIMYIVMIIFYIFSGFVLMFFFFGSLPYIFRKIHDKLTDLTTLKR